MTDHPVCRCHGEPLYWASDRSRPRGGHWRCAVKRREHDRRYNVTAKGRARRKRYVESPAGALNKLLLEMARVRVHY